MPQSTDWLTFAIFVTIWARIPAPTGMHGRAHRFCKNSLIVTGVIYVAKPQRDMLDPGSPMKMMKTNFRILVGTGLALCTFAFAPIARSQSKVSTPSQRPAAVASMESRSGFATNLETQLRQQGAEARVQLDGDRRDDLHVEWQGVRRSDIYSFVNSSAAQDAHRMGFASFTFSNGHQRWDYDLSRESMVVSQAQR